MRAISAVASLFVFTSSAFCAELPQYDTDAVCKEAATAAAKAATPPKDTDLDNAMAMCIALEKTVAKQIAARLDSLKTDALSRCDAEARGSYMKLAACLGIFKEIFKDSQITR